MRWLRSIMMMDHVKLEAFVCVAEEESFGAAADRLRTAQSTISARIEELEAHLGQRLFSRSSRHVRLTPAGEAALPAARAALAALAGVEQAVDDVVGIRRGRVRLGLVTGAEVPGLGATLAEFARTYPGIELMITTAASNDLGAAVSEGSLDVGLVVQTAPGGLGWSELLHDPLVVVGLSGVRGPVEIGTLTHRPLIVLDAGAGVRAALEEAARRSDVWLDVTAQVSTPGLAQDLYARGMGVLLVPASLAPEPGAALLDAAGQEIAVRVGFVSNPSIRTPAAELLLERLIAGVAGASRPAGDTPPN